MSDKSKPPAETNTATKTQRKSTSDDQAVRTYRLTEDWQTRRNGPTLSAGSVITATADEVRDRAIPCALVGD